MKKLSIFLIIMFLSACTTTKNISPPPTLIPGALSNEEVEFAIMLAVKDAPRTKYSNEGMKMADDILAYALGRGYTKKKYWSYEGRGKNIIYAGFNYRSYYLRAEVRYNENNVNFKIVDSRNMKQDEKNIHKNALVWLGYLERDIRATLGAIDRYKYEQELLNKAQQSDS